MQCVVVDVVVAGVAFGSNASASRLLMTLELLAFYYIETTCTYTKYLLTTKH